MQDLYKEDLKHTIRKKESTEDSFPIISDLYMLAAIPEGVPIEVRSEFWGFINKQLALANHDDIDSILNRLRMQHLDYIMSKKRYELIAERKRRMINYNNIQVMVMSLASLGKNMALLREMSRFRKEIVFGESLPQRRGLRQRMRGLFS